MIPFSKKLVLFGAGRIGRSFIAYLFNKAGYEVVFVDIDKQLIDALNIKGGYDVIVKSKQEEKLHINLVRGVLAENTKQVTRVPKDSIHPFI